VVVQNLELRCVNCTDIRDTIDPTALVYELRFSAKVSPDAPPTERDLLVEIGAAGWAEVGVVVVLDRPTGGCEHLVDLFASLLFWLEMLGHRDMQCPENRGRDTSG